VTDQKKTIALVVPALTELGGVPTVAKFILQTIQKSGRYDVLLISLSISASDSISVLIRKPWTWWRSADVRMLEFAGMPVHHVGSEWAELEWQRYRHRRVLTELLQRADLIQVVTGTPSAAAPCLGLNKPVVLQVATTAVVERESLLRAAKPGLMRRWRQFATNKIAQLEEQVLRDCDAVLVENRWMKQYCDQRRLIDGVQHDTQFAPPGIDSEHFVPAPHRLDRSAFDQAMQSDHHPAYLLCVARLDDHRKNFPMLIAAYAHYRSLALNTSSAAVPRLRMVGGCQALPQIAKAIADHQLGDYVDIFQDASDAELLRHYQHALVFCLASNEEGFGMVLIEAMACGLPLVATRCGGPESIVEVGSNGYLVDCHDATAMAIAMQQASADLSHNFALGKAARASVESRFSLKAAGERFLQTYSRLLA
jgi:D-inositol-3-phosphate glycosyltransferase